MELTILMSCLNEAETLETCIRKAKTFLDENNVDGEVLIADNGSTDGSQDIARKCGARVVDVPVRGYGAALIAGSKAALGEYVIMGDADDSYDFLHLMPFVEKLRDGYDLVMGNRFKGGIEKGAMSPLHRYLGNPVLSFIGRLFYPSKIGDFHCGLRGYNRERILELNLQTTGMEYASEMVVKCTLNKYKMAEVPTTLSPDGRSGSPHLRSWSDGWRHLKFLLIHSPNWLFLYPGMVLFAIGMILMIVLGIGPVTIKTVTFDVHTMMYGAAFTIIGATVIQYSVFTKIYAASTNYIPTTKSIETISKITTEKGVLCGFIMFLTGLAVTIAAFVIWGRTSFGDLNPSQIMRITIPAMVLMVLGVQCIFGGFFVSILRLKAK